MQRGRILVVEENALAETDRLWDRVREEGYGVTVSGLEATPNVVRGGCRPDVVILNFLAADHAGGDRVYVEAAERLAMAAGRRRLPVIAVGHPRGGRPMGVADVVAAPYSAARLVARIAALSRLATMQAEMRRRMETAAEFGVDAPEASAPAITNDANVLVAGSGRRFMSIETALSRAAVIVGSFSRNTALDYLSRRDFDCIVVNQRADLAQDFVRDLRRDPGFFTVPLIVLLDEREADHVDRLYAAGATEVVFDPHIEMDLARAVQTAVAEHRFRLALQSVYARGRQLVISDTLTNLYTRGFFLAHLTRMLAEAETSGEPVAVATVELADLGTVNAIHGHAAGDHVIRQAGLCIGRLTRGEDVAARIGGARFAMMMPNTAADEAEIAMRRCVAVIGTTRFAVPGSLAAADVHPFGRVAEARPGDTAEAILERLAAPL
jgi:diguanylate cyclase (GGDEF)-like protein